MAKREMRQAIETGCPDGFQYMHPLMVKNFGQWKTHDHPRPGVLRHIAKSGDAIWTVRAVSCATLGTVMQMDVCVSRFAAILNTCWRMKKKWPR